MEERKDLLHYEDCYSISNLGRIKSKREKRSWAWEILRSHITTNGYPRVKLCVNGKRFYVAVHRLVAMTFITNTENKLTVNHINWIKTDNRVENLEWMTIKENTIHARDDLGISFKYWRDPKKVCQYTMDGTLVKVRDSINQASRGVSVAKKWIRLCIQWVARTARWFKWQLADQKETDYKKLVL